MSRSVTGGKAPGFEYWTSRPGNRCGASPGAETKRRTHRAERRDGKQEAQRQQHESGRERD